MSYNFGQSTQFQQMPNPFTQLLQQNNSMQIGSTPSGQNNSVQTGLPYSSQYTFPQSSFNLMQYQYQETKLVDKIRELKLNGVDIVEIEQIKSTLGEDCKGIDIVCANNQKMIAIKYLDPINVNQVKEIAYFEYCCCILQNHFKREITKVLISNVNIDVGGNAVINRCGIIQYVNSNKTELYTKTAEYIKLAFGFV